jgi:hypothetical protein
LEEPSAALSPNYELKKSTLTQGMAAPAHHTEQMLSDMKLCEPFQRPADAKIATAPAKDQSPAARSCEPQKNKSHKSPADQALVYPMNPRSKSVCKTDNTPPSARPAIAPPPAYARESPHSARTTEIKESPRLVPGYSRRERSKQVGGFNI